jgi:hypothetical protein
VTKGYAAILLLAVAGCTSVPVAVCPAVREWTPGQQAEAAEEILALPPGSILVEMMLDYAETRAKLRACQ